MACLTVRPVRHLGRDTLFRFGFPYLGLGGAFSREILIGLGAVPNIANVRLLDKQGKWLPSTGRGVRWVLLQMAKALRRRRACQVGLRGDAED